MQHQSHCDPRHSGGCDCVVPPMADDLTPDDLKRIAAVNGGLHNAAHDEAEEWRQRAERAESEVERLRKELEAERHRALLLEADVLPRCERRAERAEDERDALKAAEQRVRRLCELTIATSIRVQAIDQARDTLAALDHPTDTTGVDLNVANDVQASGLEPERRPTDITTDKPGWRERARARVGDRVTKRVNELMAEPEPDEVNDPMRHTGGNAEDCPRCAGRRDLAYPFICPGTDPDTTGETETR